MGTNELDILGHIARITQSDLILFFVILAIVIVPLYILNLKDRKHKNQLENERLAQYMERENRIIEVITANTTVMSKLTTTLERDGLTTSNSLDRILVRLDDQNKLSITHAETLSRLITIVDESIRKQSVLESDIKQALMLLQGGGGQ